MNNANREMFDYDNMIEKIFTGYMPNDMTGEQKRELHERLDVYKRQCWRQKVYRFLFLHMTIFYLNILK